MKEQNHFANATAIIVDVDVFRNKSFRKKNNEQNK